MKKLTQDEQEEHKRNTRYLFTRLVTQLRIKDEACNDADGARAFMEMVIHEMRNNTLFQVFVHREATTRRISEYFMQTRSEHRAAEIGKEQSLYRVLMHAIYTYCTEQDLIEITDALVLTVNGERTIFHPIKVVAEFSDKWNLVSIDMGFRDLVIYAVYKKHTHLAQGKFFFSKDIADAYYRQKLGLERNTNTSLIPVDEAGRNLTEMIAEINATSPGSITAIFREIINIHD